MKQKYNQGRRHSLFLKLIGVAILTLIAVDLAVVGFWRHAFGDRFHGRAEKHFSQYAELLLSKMAEAKDTLEVAALVRKLDLDASVRTSRFNWISPDFTRQWTHLAATGSDTVVQDRIHLRWAKGQLAAELLNGADTVAVIASMRPFESAGKPLIALALALGVILFANWFGLRHILRPVRELERGVQAIEQGDLKYRLPEKGKDELARLAKSFNAMTASVDQRLQAREQLLRDVSHELRSPLTRLRLAAEMLASGNLREDLLEDIHVLEKMVQEILESERLTSSAGALKRTPVDFIALLREEIASQSGRLPGIRESIDFSEVIWNVDAERMRIVLRNLLDNALKYSPADGQPVDISLQEKVSTWLLRIQDYGSGIPASALPHLFEPFYRVDSARSAGSGFGLGLALVKRICDAHSISIHVDSQVGQGSSFQLEFHKPG